MQNQNKSIAASAEKGSPHFTGKACSNPLMSKIQSLGRLAGMLALVSLPSTTNAATCNTDFCALDMNSRIWINNNVWGKDSSPGGWWESITTTGANSWRTDFNWPSGNNNNSVKAYPSAVLGWHYGWRFPSGTGLPVQLSANQNVPTSYSYSVNFGGGAGNVAYDLWLHTINNPTWSSTPSDEIMIWLNNTSAGPISQQPVIRVSIGGSSWDLHRGNIGWNVWSFVRVGNSGSGTLNLKNFTDYLRSNHGMSSAKYLSSVQFGTEIFRGTGNLTVNNYTCTVGGGGTQPVPNGTYSLQNRANGKMLDNLGSTADGAGVGQWTDGTSNNQRFNVNFSGGYYRLNCVTGGKYLDSINHTADGSTVNQWASSGSANQQWTFTATSGGYYKLINRANGKCLDTGGSSINGAIMQFWGSGTSNNQQWRFVAP
ncbi:MAG: RICIN domain-containing protein [Akkermansiaceae bacterium]|nr:RICIN domain-containing protein [Verrucomicrobiales bacterium]